MSRGYGTRQRTILERLRAGVDDNGWPRWVGITNGAGSAAARESIRYAARTLEDEGTIEVRRKRQLQARLPLSAKQRTQERREERSAVRKRLDRAGWPEQLWDLTEEGWLPEPNSIFARRLIRAGLPPRFLDHEWWWDHEISDLPPYLRFEPRQPRPTRREERQLRREWREEERKRREALERVPHHSSRGDRVVA